MAPIGESNGGHGFRFPALGFLLSLFDPVAENYRNWPFNLANHRSVKLSVHGHADSITQNRVVRPGLESPIAQQGHDPAAVAIDVDGQRWDARIRRHELAYWLGQSSR